MNVLITGASGGLGHTFTVECGKRGYNLFLTDVNTAGLNAIRWGIFRQYPESSIEAKECDLTDDGVVRNLLDFAAGKQIYFDILRNRFMVLQHKAFGMI